MKSTDQNVKIAMTALFSTLALAACGQSSGLSGSANSASTNTSTSSTSSTSSVASTLAPARNLEAAPVYCQQPPLNWDNPLPLCLAPLPDDCGHSQVADATGVCVDYVCDSVTEIAMPTDGSTLQIPDRSSGTHGVCYSVKLLKSISGGSSSLTKLHDLTVVSRNHDLNDNDPTNHWNPYLMGSAKMKFQMANAHQVMLAGAVDDSSPVLVDNFLIVGIAPVSNDNPVQPAFYGAFGTEDSTTNFAGGTGNVLIGTTPLQLVSFASGGTASVGPLNVSSEVSPTVVYNLDVRAEDCGGSRALSNVYILFR